MQVSELIEKTGWKLLNTSADLSKEIDGAYCGDLLSWVMGNGNPKQAWITVQVHINVIAVAVLREFSCVIVADNAAASPEMLAKADAEKLPLIASGMPAFESARKLVELGI
jgi:hypothetical protein